MTQYIRPFPHTWWLTRRSYFLFMVRELTAVFVAAYSVFLLVFVYKLGQGPEAYKDLLALIQTPGMVAVHLIILVFAVYHSVTWLNLTPKIFVVWLGERQVPPVLIAGAHHFGWLCLSVVLALIILGA